MFKLDTMERVAKATIKDPSNPDQVRWYNNEIEVNHKITEYLRKHRFRQPTFVEYFSASPAAIYFKYHGTDLETILSSATSNISLDLKKVFTSDILKGVERLHDGGFVHSDIKTANILVLNNQARIADFGYTYHAANRISYSEGPPTTGTMPYWPPEILTSDGVALYKKKWQGSTKSAKIENAKKRDVFSTAVMIAEIYGRDNVAPWLLDENCNTKTLNFPQFVQCKNNQLAKVHRKARANPNLFKNPLDQLLLKALKEDPSERITAQQFREEFERIRAQITE